MKTTLKTPLACAALAASMLGLASQVSAVELVLKNGTHQNPTLNQGGHDADLAAITGAGKVNVTAPKSYSGWDGSLQGWHPKGNGAPNDADGAADGDYYYDLDNQDTYQKAGGTYVFQQNTTTELTDYQNNYQGNTQLAQEVANPIYANAWQSTSSTGSGDSWGGAGLVIGGEVVTFTNTSMTAFDGSAIVGDAYFNGNPDGMGIWSANNSGGESWEIDGLESFTLAANADLAFEGVSFRGGYGLAADRILAVSSQGWADLTDLDGSSDLGTGVSFSISGGIGTFLLTVGESIVLADILGTHDVELTLEEGEEVTFARGAGSTKDLALGSLSFGPGTVVPEPGTYALLAGCFALASVMIRRRR